MELRGHVHNGVIVIEDSRALPEGVRVRIVFETEYPAAAKEERVRLPLVPSSRPGSLRLTGDDIAQVLEDDDLAAGH